ncbi:MAG: hypothetical protein WA705_16105 [Candidatus Ozemobacteraceae bacterium]
MTEEPENIPGKLSGALFILFDGKDNFVSAIRAVTVELCRMT